METHEAETLTARQNAAEALKNLADAKRPGMTAETMRKHIDKAMSRVEAIIDSEAE